MTVGTSTPSALTYIRDDSAPPGVFTLQSAADQSISNCSLAEAFSTALPSLSTTCRSISSDIATAAAALRFSALRAKLRPAMPRRQHSSRIPTLTPASNASTRRSTGVSLPSPAPVPAAAA